MFKQIELNMREIGFGDVHVNKNMKFLIKSFYSILMYCEKYKKEPIKSKRSFFSRNLSSYTHKDRKFNDSIVNYFDKFQAFCFDLSSDSVLSGELKFNYN